MITFLFYLLRKKQKFEKSFRFAEEKISIEIKQKSSIFEKLAVYFVLLFIDEKERLKTKSPFTLPKKTVRRCLPTPSRFFFVNSASLLTPVCFLKSRLGTGPFT